MLGEQIIPAELDALRESLRDSVQYLELTRFRGHPQTWPTSWPPRAKPLTLRSWG